MRDDRPLFIDGDLSAVLRQQEESLKTDVDAYDGDRLLNTPADDLCSYFVEKYRIQPIELMESDITVDQQETTLDPQRIPNARFLLDDEAGPVPATAFSFIVPFTGEGDLFRLRPGTFTSNPPRATVQGDALVLTFTTHHPEGESVAIPAQFKNELQQIRSYLGFIKAGVDAFNNNILPNAARLATEARRARLLKAQSTVASLGYPLRRRPDAPTTYAAPTVRRKIVPPQRLAGSEPFQPEPTLATEDYEHILTVVHNMALVLERSPSAFATMGEEDLRQHFLVQLNGHYEGSATGETFNVQGKTDILVREGGKNLFIAECKFWRGPAGFQDTIEQLLGYTSWRDTKTAIILFNRDVAFSTVLAKIPEELAKHANFKRAVPQEGETRFRAVLRHKNDPSRELILTVLAFDVPR